MCDALATTFDVVCECSHCPAQGVARTVRLQEVGDGIVARPTLLCVHCGMTPLTVVVERKEFADVS